MKVTTPKNAFDFHQLMGGYLGTRYDHFTDKLMEYLLFKIAFALYSHPKNPISDMQKPFEFYETGQQKDARLVYEQIKRQSEEHFKQSSDVYLKILFNVGEVGEDIVGTWPIFVIRNFNNTHGSKKKVFIDHDLRVYFFWKDYKTQNQLPECKMVLPKGGKYVKDQDGYFQVETDPSPSSSFEHKFAKYADNGALGVSVVAAGIALIAPPVTLPAILTCFACPITLPAIMTTTGRYIFN